MTGKTHEMLYITEKSFNRQILLLSNLSNKTRLELVIWLYPESIADSIIGFNTNSPATINALPVTTYPGNTAGRCTQRLQMTADLIETIVSNERCFIGECDSICIYHPEKAEWGASVILHEGMILIRDSSLLVNPEALDFKVSPHAPSWW
ncbi:hypothetical protein [Pseudomonas fluorescens]|uniref:hypothetical protein n=1 Tax=Pseudomonas fluorescens TaxID=294 RepID=UPI001A9EF9F7|nr:hypothetical protein [Pseudomonas fluorescens]QTD35850.1 hypothetical protein JZM58_13620 [Pseudomonas fluorescens]